MLDERVEHHASNAANATRQLTADLQATEERVCDRLGTEIARLDDAIAGGSAATAAVRMAAEADVEELQKLDEFVRTNFVQKMATVQSTMKSDQDELVALGTLLDGLGNTKTSLEHRLRQAATSFILISINGFPKVQ